VGDFNGDSKLDLATVNSKSDTANVLLGNGNGTFGTQRTYTIGTAPYATALGDFNADGNTDLVGANEFANTLSVFLGNGDGTFAAPQTFAAGKNPAHVDEPSSLVVGDFDGDGNLDLATTNEEDGTVSVLLGNGNGVLQAQRTFAVGTEPRSVAAGDFN